MTRRRVFAGLLALVVLGVATACTTSIDPRDVQQNAQPEPTATPAPITLPQDEQAHDTRLEWWYHSGHLESESGREFGFHFVVFKSDDGNSEPNLVAQLGILDVESGKHVESSRAEAGMRQVGEGAMTLGIADWVYGLLPIDGSHSFVAYDSEFGLSLNLEAASQVMLHKETGWLPTEVGATYYYSWPRQEAIGELALNGEKMNVTGTGWFDHQWGDFFVLGKPAGWQWFAIQLDDGGSLMITEARGADGSVTETYGTYMSPEGIVTSLRKDVDGIDLEVLGEWTSIDTGATYPSDWTLKVDSLNLDIAITPVANDQEIQGGLPAASTYWEGKSRVVGTLKGLSVSGNAYVELSGYAEPDPIEWMSR